MKNNLVRVSILVLGAAAAYAQGVGPLKADIPFDFNARGMSMPAGNYSIDTKNPMIVVLRSHENRVNAVVGAGAVESLTTQKEGRLVFHRYGNQYFLSDIWISGSSYGRHLAPSQQERNLAKRQTEPGEVIVAALR